MEVQHPAAKDCADETRSLTAALAIGDEEAFRQFHTAYFDRLFRYLIVVTRGDEDAARDALQETFTRVVRHARAFESPESLWSWLAMLARSAAADVGRKRRTYWRLIASYAMSLIPSGSDAGNDSTDERLQALLQQALATLPEVERALVQAKYEWRVSVRDLAAEYGLTEKAVESRLVRARREMRTTVLTMLKNENLS
jgi:RNA polymerase sigma-70 factor (ECF subfamily)